MSTSIEVPAQTDQIHQDRIAEPSYFQSIIEVGRNLIGRAALAIALASGMLAVEATTLENRPAHAEAGTYPDADATPRDLSTYTWWKDENNNGVFNTGEEISSRGYGYRNCTDWAAWQASRLTAVSVPWGLGDAKHWHTNAPATWIVDARPEPGDIAQSDAGTYGHLGVVEGYTKDAQGGVASVLVSEYNRAGDGNYTLTNYSADSSGVFWRNAARTKKWDRFFDLNGTGRGINGEDLIGGGSGGSYLPLTQHVYSGTLDGKAYETYWGPSDTLTTAQMAQVSSPVTAVTNQIADNVHHIYFGTQGGEIYETYWGGGNNLTTSMLTDLNTPINAISSQIHNGVQHVYSGTEAGTLHETYWGRGVPLSTWQVANIGSAVTSLSSLITPTGVQSVFSGSVDGKLQETYWGGGNALTSYRLATLPNRVNSLTFYITADSTRHVFSGTVAGKVYETYWGGGNSLTTAEMATLPTAITGISAQQSPNGIHHIYTGTQEGTLHETYWGNGSSLTTSQVGKVDSSVKSISSLITPDGVQHIYTGTAAGALYETYWGGGTSLTTSQLSKFPAPVGSIFSRLT